MSRKRFSKRMGLDRPIATEITIRNDAPDGLRQFIIALSYEIGISPKPLRQLICRVLRAVPDPNNWSEWPNIDYEIQNLLAQCPWYRVYDIIEEISGYLKNNFPLSRDNQIDFEEEVNAFFIQNGIGWQLINGEIQVRGSEIFEEIIRSSIEVLSETGRNTARNEIHKSLVALSLRPEPDVTGAVQHALAAVECVARDVCGDPRATLGEILRRYPNIIPRPLDTAIEKVWGYASEHGRHLQEGREPTMEEAELLVGMSGVAIIYLVKKLGLE